MKKVAFLTMDVETFFDTSCIAEKGIPHDGDYDAKQGFADFVGLLDRFGAKATLFLTDSVLDNCSDLISRCACSGHELAVHALVHRSPLELNTKDFVSEICQMRQKIQDKFGVTAEGYRAPCFGITDEQLIALQNVGFRYDSSALNFKSAARSGNVDLSDFTKLSDCVYQRGDFGEIKPPVGKWLFGKIPVGGGAYLRMIPRLAAKSVLKRHIKKVDSYVFYVHPFELTTCNYPQTKYLSAGERLFVNRGRKTYLKFVEELLKLLVQNGYEFCTMGNYVCSLNNKKATAAQCDG